MMDLAEGLVLQLLWYNNTCAIQKKTFTYEVAMLWPRPLFQSGHSGFRLDLPEGLIWLGPQNQVVYLLNSSLRGFVSCAMTGENFPNWLTMPRNRLNSSMD